MRAVRAQTAHQACENAIRRAVLDGELTPGEKLPPERKLAGTLGVSRLTLRSALAALTAQGILAVRQGSGYIVQDIARTGGGDLIADIASQADERGDRIPIATELFRVRRHLAHAVLEHLVEHPPKATAIKKFEQAIDAMEAATRAEARRAPRRQGEVEVEGRARGEAEAIDIAEADLNIVATLLDATQSPVLRLCINPISAVVMNTPWLRAAIYAEPASNVVGWRGLVAWLKKPQRPDLAVALLAARDAATLERLRRKR